PPPYDVDTPSKSRCIHHLAIVAAAKKLVSSHIDVLTDEVHRAIAEGEIRAPRVLGFETPGDGPVEDVSVRIAGAIIIVQVRRSLIVNRDDRTTMFHAGVRPGPSRS